MVFFVFDDMIENGDGAFVAELLELLAVVGDVAALFDFEATQGHADAAGAIGERVGFSAGVAGVNGLSAAEFHDAAVPEGGVLQLGSGEVAQNLGADGVIIAVGEGLIGVVAFHLGLPVGFEGRQNLLQLGAAQGGGGHGCVSLRSLEDTAFCSEIAVMGTAEKRGNAGLFR